MLVRKSPPSFVSRTLGRVVDDPASALNSVMIGCSREGDNKFCAWRLD